MGRHVLPSFYLKEHLKETTIAREPVLIIQLGVGGNDHLIRYHGDEASLDVDFLRFIKKSMTKI